MVLSAGLLVASVPAAGNLPGTMESGSTGPRDFPAEPALNRVFDSASPGSTPVIIAGAWTEGLSHAAESGSDRLLVFLAHAEHDAPSISLQSVIYGGQPMTKVIQRVQGTGWSAYTAAFILHEAGIATAAGSTFEVNWSGTPARPPVFSSVFLSGVDQTTPVGDSDGNGLNSTATVSTAPLATLDGDMVIVAGTCGNTGTYSVNNGFTKAIEQVVESADAVSGYKSAVGNDETPSVTHSNAIRQAVIGFVVRAGLGEPAPPDTIPPSVALVAPADGDTLFGTVTIQATASDNGAVSRVEFLLDGAPLGDPDSSAPYSFLWDTELHPDTTHTLSAVAFDAAGLQAVAEITVHLTEPPPPDTIPPSVSFLMPADGDSISGTVRVEAAASDDRGVEYVEFFLDGVSIRNPDYSAPYAFFWNTDPFPDTTHLLSAVAFDTSGLQSGVAITIHLVPPPPPDTIPPSVTIVRPSDGDTLSGSVVVEAVASDDREVDYVEFRLDGVPIGPPDNSSPYLILLDSDLYTKEAHTLSAVAFDTAGLEAGAHITVHLVQQPPPENPPAVVAVHVPAWDVHMGPGTNGNYGVMPVDSIDFSTMTHYVSFAAGLASDGSAMQWGNLVSSRRKPLNDRVHAAGKPVLLTIGGTGSDGSLSSALSPENREASINTILSAVRTNGYDGIDWDWEPFGRSDSALLFPVIRALADSFDQPWWSAPYDPAKKIIQTADINPCCGLAYVWADVSSRIEFYMIMAYDKMGSWTGMTYFDYAPYSRVNGVVTDISRSGEEMATAQNQAIDLLTAGVDPAKVVIGMDFMAAISSGGSGMPNGGATRPREIWDTSPSFRIDVKFDEFYQDFLDGAPNAVHFDDTAKAYFLSIDQPGDSADKFISFAGSPGHDSTLYYQLRLARELNIGGIMLWDLSESYLGTGRFPEAEYPTLDRNWLTNQMRTHIGGIEPPPDVYPPSIAFMAPADGDSVFGTVVVEAAASDNREVSYVEFLLDGVPMGTPDYSAPYTIDWVTDPLLFGSYTLSAVVHDQAGLQTGAGITVQLIPTPPDTVPPTVSFLRPADGDSISGSILIEAEASDNRGMRSVQFFLDDVPLRNPDYSAPYRYFWNTDLHTDTTHTLSAVAIDTAGLQSVVAITVHLIPDPADTVPPTVSFLTPADGDSLTGSVAVEATATDNVGVSRVEFLLDSVILGAPDSVAPYSMVWDTGPYSDTIHMLSAVAFDTTGLSSRVDISVRLITPPPQPDTIPPVVGFVTPADGDSLTGSVAIEATATDNVGVSRVEFLLDSIILGAPDSVAPYSMVWDTGPYSDTIHTLSAVAFDTTGLSSRVDISVRLITPPPPNNPPAFAADTLTRANGTAGLHYSGSIAAEVNDPDGDTLIFSKTGGPVWLAVAADGILSGIPDSGNIGANSFTIHVEDGKGGSDDAVLAITIDAAPLVGGPVGIVGSWTEGLTHGVEPGNGRLLVFMAFTEHDAAISLNTVTYGGQPMTKVIDRVQGTGFVAYTAAFVLDETGISAASGATFVPGWSASPARTPGYSSVFLSGVDQAAPVGASASNGQNNTATVTTGALSTADGDMVFLGATCGNTGTYTVNNGFTEAVELVINSADGVSGHKAATGATETPSVTHSNGNRQSIIGFVVNAAPGGPPAPNNPPAFAADTLMKANGTVGLVYTGSIAGDAADPDSDPLTFSKTGGAGWLNVAANGALSGVPGDVNVGSNSFTVHVEDGRGGGADAVLNITIDAAPVGGGPVSIAGSWTEGLSHGVEPGSGRLLVFISNVEHNNPNIALNGVTYGGQAMTKVIERVQGTGFVAYTVAFVLNESGIAAASDGAFVPAWSESPSRTPGYSSVFLSGADQAAPVGASASNGQNNTGTITTDALSTADGDMVFLGATCGNSGTYVVNNGFTEALELTIPSADGVSGFKAATGADETPSVTHSNGNRQALIGFVVKATPGSPPAVSAPRSGPEIPASPREFRLDQNYPNPFNPVTTISYALPSSEHVRVTVYNALGRQIAVLVDHVQQAGFQSVTFDGRGLASGMYTYRITAGRNTAIRRMLLLK